MPPPPRPPVSSRDAIVDLAERQTPRAIYVVSLLTAVAAFSLAVMQLPDARPAPIAAATPLHGLSEALSRYSDETGALPVELGVLLNGWLDDPDLLDDAWGRRILYGRTADGDALLVSLGADASEGGAGHDQDLVVRVLAPQRDILRRDTLRRDTVGQPPR